MRSEPAPVSPAFPPEVVRPAAAAAATAVREPDAGPAGPVPSAPPPFAFAPVPPPPAAAPGAPAGRRHPSAGRNLPAAIGVAAILIAVLLASLWFRPEPFIVLVCVAVVLGAHELSQAMGHGGVSLAFLPLAVGGVAVQVSGYLSGPAGVLCAFFLTAGAVIAWRATEGTGRTFGRDAMVGVLASIYLPLLAGCATLLVLRPRGRWLVLTFIALSIANDTGGYIAGVLFGKHKLAPSVSPKKSWEGLAGSVALCALAAWLAVWLLGAPAWLIPLLALGAVVTSTLGDLIESLLKRDLGIKDMGHLLPGHGGVLDRIDSILLSAPAAYLVFLLI
ncbi:MAG: phosphatidate cytidylyltransferase [Bifidobacteriaceae bacterium]|nr:phosphatidate cytidylyltransferase [Bifidobacteriaceae bacterium]